MKLVTAASLFAVGVLACEDCSGPQSQGAQARNVRRMQPGAPAAIQTPPHPLRWGQLNFLHTTDTHGWLEGHLKERNYGADWGDFAAFTRHMKHKADRLNVDLLLIDTGDLHDGAGLSDVTTPNGLLSNVIFENIDYDLLTIGNHELSNDTVAYETAVNFTKVYGDRYLTSNVQIKNQTTQKFQDIGSKYRYFTTDHGLRIMSFGIIYDLRNAAWYNVTPAATLVKETWFVDAVKEKHGPIDLFVVIGHNPVDGKDSTLKLIFDVIRGMRPAIPIQFFAGHSHRRNFTVYDLNSTAIESGAYCETAGWLSLSGINSTNFTGALMPKGVPNPTQKAVKVSSTTKTAAAKTSSSTNLEPSGLLYSRRYLDWNRLTFAFHGNGSQDYPFDDYIGSTISNKITETRASLKLNKVFGCAPKTWCIRCQPFGHQDNIYTLVKSALNEVVINQTRGDVPRLIFTNIGGIRFDLVQGPFTYDDQFIVSPFYSSFQYIANVSHDNAVKILDKINGKATPRSLETRNVEFEPYTDACLDSTSLKPRSFPLTRGLYNRQNVETLGHHTTDDFGDDGDDTPHKKPLIPFPNKKDLPKNLQVASVDLETNKDAIDVIFISYLHDPIITALKQINGTNFSTSVKEYVDHEKINTLTYLSEYAKKNWKQNGTCEVGPGVGD